jgi:hypothetical protein
VIFDGIVTLAALALIVVMMVVIRNFVVLFKMIVVGVLVAQM